MAKILRFIYSIYLLLGFLICVIVFAPLILLCSLLPEEQRFRIMRLLVKGMSKMWFGMSGIYTKVYNKELFVSAEGAVIVANHLSYLDAPATYCAIPVPFKALGKAEIGKMPIFGLSYKAVVVSVDRSSTTDRVKSFRKMKEFLAKGISILVFPEGTFHEGNEALLPFHDGAFKLAVNMQAVIQPVLLLDTQKRMNFQHLFQSSPGKNRVVVLPAIHTAGIAATQDSLLKNYVFEYLNACYEYVLKNGAENSKEFAQKYLDHQPINF